jgi:7,8-dihydroneopterin aldolase/epimerase/oxygenase
MDAVFLKDLKVVGKHGVYEHERRAEQEFLVDIEASFDTRAASASDKLEDSTDYDAFAKIAKEVVERNTFYLIERLADSIAKEILADVRIASVRVTVRKPAALQSGVPGVSIERNRE